jgi:DNA-binding NarL/FixJ family response regulator
MPRISPYKITLTDEEQSYLNSIARKYTAPYRDVIRAQVILLVAEGLENKAIGEKLNLPRKTVSKWRKRFFLQRKRGLEDIPRTGRPFTFSP